MKILLVAATFAEIRPFYEKASLPVRHDEHLSSCRLDKKDIDVLITGVGMTSTAYRMGKMFSENHYDFAVNAGIAGAFSKSLEYGDVVNVDRDVIAELGAENGDSFQQLDTLDIGQSSLENSIWKVQNKMEICNPVIQKLPRVKGITVNTVHGNKHSIEKVTGLFQPDIETMEGAAFLHICNEEKTYCVQLRSISNYVEERNPHNWNIELAIEKLNEILVKIIKSL